MDVDTALKRREVTAVLWGATADEVPAVMALFADDQLGTVRDGAADPAAGPDGLQPYLRDFSTIDADPAHLLLVAVADGALAATMHLSFLPGFARRSALRAQVEAVRVAATHRSSGLGTAMIT